MIRSRTLCVSVSLMLVACGGASATGPSTPSTAASRASGSPTRAVPSGVDAVVRVGPAPCAATEAAGKVWITLMASGVLAAVDPASNAVDTFHVGGDPCGIGQADGDLWIATVQGEEVLRFDLARSAVVDRVSLGDQIWDLQADNHGVWVALRSKAEVVRIDPSDGKIVARIAVGGSLSGLAITPDGVWVADELGDRVVRIDPDTNRIAVDRHIGGFAAEWFGSDADQLWVASMEGEVARIDERTGDVLDRVHVPGKPLDLDVAGSTAWVPANQTGVLWTIDVGTGRAVKGPTLASGIYVAQVLAGAVWVLNYSGTEVYRLPG